MRLIPGKTKVKIELFKGVGIGDIVVGIIGIGLVTLLLMSTIPFKYYISIAIAVIFGGLLFKLDTEPTYMFLINVMRYFSYGRAFTRLFSDARLIEKTQGVVLDPASQDA